MLVVPPKVEPPKTGRAREDLLATLPSRFPENEEAAVVHRPKTVSGNIVAIVIGLVGALALVQSAIAVSGAFAWAFLAIGSSVAFVAIVMHRRAQAASDLALADAPSFADVLPHWNKRVVASAEPVRTAAVNVEAP
jgi:hypothetical protein